MAFSLCLEFNEQRFYIHRSYNKNTEGPKTTTNQNYAMLFSSDIKAKEFAKNNEIPPDYIVKFIAMPTPKLKRESSNRTSNSGAYRKIDSGGVLDDSIPSFLKGLE